MRKLALLAVLSVLFVPALASAQLSLGARVGYGFAMGEGFDGFDLGDAVKAQIPLQLDLGYRVTPALTLGGYFSYGIGRAGDECDDCSGRVMRLGVQLDYTFKGASMSPWVGAGFGYEWLTVDDDVDEMKLSGFEFLNLQGGIDWKVGTKLSVGPFAMLSIAQYSNAEFNGAEEDIPDDFKTMHQWFQIGVRGRFDL